MRTDQKGYSLFIQPLYFLHYQIMQCIYMFIFIYGIIITGKPGRSETKMTEPAKQARREYYREWRRKNPDKVKATQQRYWLRKAEQIQRAEQRTAADPESRSDK